MLPVPRRQAVDQHTCATRQAGAQREIKHHPSHRFAGPPQRHHLHISKSGHKARHQADDARKHLVLLNGGAQHHDHPDKTAEHRQHQGALAAHVHACAGQGAHQGAAHQKSGNPHTAHVVQGHGGGQGQFAQGIKPCAQRKHPHHIAPKMHHWNGRVQ